MGDKDTPLTGGRQLTLCPFMVQVLDPVAGVHEMTISLSPPWAESRVARLTSAWAGVGLTVEVIVGVLVGVLVGLLVGVLVGVFVGVGVIVAVWVIVGVDVGGFPPEMVLYHHWSPVSG